MRKFRWFLYGFSISLLGAGTARAQILEESERETLRPRLTQQADNAAAPDLVAAAQLIVDRTNAFRRREGSEAVAIDPKLRKATRYFAAFMANTDQYGHHADGNHPAQRASAHGYDYCIVSENIATVYNSTGFTTAALARQFFQGWRDSPGHRANMLAPAVRDTSVSIARSAETGYFYAVQMFGRSESEALLFDITNQADTVVNYEIGERVFSLPPRFTRSHQRCRPTRLTLQWPNGQPGTTLEPAGGDHLTINRNADGDFRLTTE
jgi:uncharacterized protein YkwD